MRYHFFVSFGQRLRGSVASVELGLPNRRLGFERGPHCAHWLGDDWFLQTDLLGYSWASRWLRLGSLVRQKRFQWRNGTAIRRDQTSSRRHQWRWNCFQAERSWPRLISIFSSRNQCTQLDLMDDGPGAQKAIACRFLHPVLGILMVLSRSDFFDFVGILAKKFKIFLALFQKFERSCFPSEVLAQNNKDPRFSCHENQDSKHWVKAINLSEASTLRLGDD